MNTLKRFFSRKLVYIPLIVVVIIGGLAYAHSQKQVAYTTIAASRSDFVQVISATGKVVAADDVDLSFETAGKVAAVNVKVGDQVKRGQTLASLSGGDANANLLGAQARLDTEKIKLQDLQAGNRPEEITIKETAATNSKIAKDQSEDSLKKDISDSYVASDDLIKNKINAFFYRSPTDTKEDIIPFRDAAFKDELDRRKDEIDTMMVSWGRSIDGLQKNGFDPKYEDEAIRNLSTLRDFLSDVAIAVSKFSVEPNITQATIDKYKADVSSSREIVNASISTINNGNDALQTAELNIKTAENDLALSKAGSTSFDIDAQAAVVKSAEASVLEAQAEASKNVIIAPFDGIVTKVDATVGELSSLSVPSVSLISAANFEIESFIPEADIAKVHLGDNAKVTLDAYGSNTNFDAVITKIDPAETVIEGVSTYRTTLQFANQDDRIKSGMTANLDIQGQVRHDVLSVPQSAVIYDEDNNKTVYLLKDGEKKPEVRSVRTGQTGDAGNVEIVDGITEGEKVVTNPPR